MEDRELDLATKVADVAAANRRIMWGVWIVLGAVLTFLVGLGGGYLKWGQREAAPNEFIQLQEQVNPRDGYALPVSFGDLGPRLVEAGVIDYDAFLRVMSAGGGGAVDSRQMGILKNGADDQIVITTENTHFLLNLFWAVGLANKNSILTEGPMVQYSQGQIDRFASTGGWTLATRPIAEIYASLDLIPLTPEQQARVEEVAAAVYRPCCDNHTLFPDCNHGMAMLGLLELMASQNASVDEMFEAAKYVNAYWFPQQALETAIYLKAHQDIDFSETDPRLIVSKEFSSASGAARVHESLQAGGLLQQSPDGPNGCTN